MQVLSTASPRGKKQSRRKVPEPNAYLEKLLTITAAFWEHNRIVAVTLANAHAALPYLMCALKPACGQVA